jgi:hypothetical protein
MNLIPSTYNKRNMLIGSVARPVQIPISGAEHALRIQLELKNLGASFYGIRRFGSRYLPNIIQYDEKIGGIVYGYNEVGSVMLLATDRRVIFLDKKPFYFNQDEVSYDVVSGVSFAHAGFGSTVILHTRVKDYVIKTLNQKCAIGFMKFVENKCLTKSD